MCAAMCSRAQPRRGQAVRAIGSDSDAWNAHYSTPLSTADHSTADSLSNAHYSDADDDADLRRWYCPFVL